MIPYLIHQTWKTRDLPACYLPVWQDSWRRHNPTFEYVLHTDEDNRKLVGDCARDLRLPDLLAIFDDENTRGVIKSDFARLLYLWKFGGVYVDLDYACLKPIEPLLSGHRILLSLMDGDDRRYIHNAFIAAEPGCDFFQKALTSGVAQWKRCVCGPHWVSGTAGPRMLSRLVAKMPSGNLSLVVPELLCPLNWKRGESAKKSPSLPMELTEASLRWPQAYAVTFWTHNW